MIDGKPAGYYLKEISSTPKTREEKKKVRRKPKVEQPPEEPKGFDAAWPGFGT